MTPARRPRRPGRRVLAGLVRCSLGAALLAAAVVLLPAGAAMACSCAAAPSDQALVARSDVVFTGTLVERHEPTVFPGLSSSSDPAVLVFAVDTVHKGSVAERQGVETARSGASCGLELTQGREVLLLADRVDGHLVASLCGGSRELTAGKQPLGAGATPPGVRGAARRRAAPGGRRSGRPGRARHADGPGGAGGPAPAEGWSGGSRAGLTTPWLRSSPRGADL